MSKAGYLVPPLQGSGGARIGKVTHRSPRWAFFGDAPMALRELQNLCCVMRCVQSWGRGLPAAQASLAPTEYRSRKVAEITAETQKTQRKAWLLAICGY